MDSMAFQKAFTFMLESGIIIKSFISEQHASIAMREECPNRCKDLDKPIIDHFFDLWHIAISKYHIQPLLFHGYFKLCDLIHGSYRFDELLFKDF